MRPARLPSVAMMRAIEAVDRLGSVVAAARELSMTHSAVSKQLKSLEVLLGVALFSHGGGRRSLEMTATGRRYARSIRSVLGDLAEASLEIQSSREDSFINIGVPSAFGRYRFTRILNQFVCAHPEIQVNQFTRVGQFDFYKEKLDAAVYYGTKDWNGVKYHRLLQDRVIPAASPELMKSAPETVEDVSKYSLLRLANRADAWSNWFKRHSDLTVKADGIIVDQFESLVQAACDRLGIALLSEFVAINEFKAGRLVPAWHAFTDVEEAYYLVWPKSRRRKPALDLLIDWTKR